MASLGRCSTAAEAAMMAAYGINDTPSEGIVVTVDLYASQDGSNGFARRGPPAAVWFQPFWSAIVMISQAYNSGINR